MFNPREFTYDKPKSRGMASKIGHRQYTYIYDTLLRKRKVEQTLAYE